MRNLLLFFLLGILLFVPFSSKATHIVGADISYRCLNSTTNLYEITVTVFRDCAPGNANYPNNITLFFFASSTGGIYTTRVVNTPGNIPQIIPSNWTACSNQPYTLCVERATYVTTQTLPPRVGGYDIGWAVCCRNNTVTNISPNQGITITSHVPGTNQAVGCNSQPTFNNLAPQFLCAGQPFSFDHSAIDADGDSLVYSVCNPYTGVNSVGLGATQNRPTVGNAGFNPNRMGPPPYANVNYLSPTYSYTNPFGSGTFNIDPQSGRLTLTPTQVGQFVFAICVKEYRNGVLLSEQKRDFQINVITCVNQALPPSSSNTAGSLPNSSNDTLYIEALDSVCYDVTLSGALFTDSVELFAVSGPFGVGGNWPPPLATLTFTTPNPNVGQVQGRVCWKTACTNAGDTARLIIGGNNISNCFGLNVTFDTIVVVVGGAAAPVLQHVLPGGGTGNNITINPQQTLTYSFLATDRDPDSVRIFTANGPFAGPNAAVLVDTGSNPVAGTVTWTPTCADAGQTYQFVIAARDTNICNNQTTVYDTVNVTVRPLPVVSIAPIDPILCIGSTLPIITTATGATVGMTYAWTPGSTLTDSSIANPVATPTDTTTYSLTVTDIYGCQQAFSTTVKVVPLPTVTITQDTFNCPGDSLPLLATGGSIYSWTPILGLSDPNIANPLAAPVDTTIYTVVVTDTNGCQSQASVRVNTMNIAVNPNRAICQRDTTSLFATGGVSYSWSPSLGLSDSTSRTPRAFPLATTNYTVTVVDINGCVDTRTTQVRVLPLPVIATSPDTVICRGDTFNLTAFSAAAGTYAWTPATGLSDTSLGSPLAFPTTTTTYTLVVTSTNSCKDSRTVNVGVNALPIVSAGQDTTNCEHQGVPIAATGAATYVWTPALGLSDSSIANPIANPLISTTYTVIGQDTNGCYNSDQVNVTVFNGSVIADQTICRFDSVALPALGGVSYLWQPATGLSDPASASPKASPAVTTQYIVDIFHPSGCSDPDTVTVFVNPLPIVSTSPDTMMCIFDTIFLRAAGGVGYQWVADPTLASPTSAVTAVFPQASTQYFIAVTDTNTCVNYDSIQVVVNPLPIVSAGQDTTNCEHQGVPILATGAATYTWSPALGLSDPSIANPIANPLVSTTYTVVGIDTNSCVNSDQVNVTVFNGSVIADQTICRFDSVALPAVGGVSYRWRPAAGLSDTTAASPKASPAVTTQYIVDIFHPSGCSDPDTVTVFVNPLPIVTTSPDTMMCIYDTIILRATGGVGYQWSVTPSLASPNSAVTAVFPLTSTLYQIAVTDTNTCVNYDSVFVTVNSLPIVDAGNDTAKCGNLGITLTATGGVQYNWFPATGLNNANIASPVANPDSSTQYYVLVTDSNLCRNVDSVFVRTMYADAGLDVEICIYDSVQLGASGGVSYSWDNGATLTQNSIADPFAFPQTTTLYVVTATDTVGCIDTDTVRVQVNPLPVTSLTSPDAYVCSGGATQLTATGGNTYIWRPDTTLSALNIPNPIGNPLNLTANLVDSTWYFVTVIDSNGCVNYDSIGIEVRLLPILASSNDTFACPGTSVPISAAGGIAYSWAPALGLDNPGIPNPNASPDTTTRYVATVVAVWGCIDTTSVLVYTIDPQAGNDEVICFGDSVQLLASGGVSYSWAPATGLSDPNIRDPKASPAVTTTYIVTIIDSVNCVDTDTMTVLVNPLPPADAGPDDVICIFDSTTLNASGGVQYLWDFSPVLSNLAISNPVANPQTTTTFYVTVTDTNGCFERDSMTVLVNPLPLANAGPDLTKCGEPGIQLQASGGIIYQWFPPDSLSDTGISNPVASPTDTTTYYVVVTDTNGCVNIDSMTVSTMYASTGPGGTICFGDTLALSAAGGIGYTWLPAPPLSDAASDSTAAFPDTTTTFIVTVLDPSGCTDTASVTVIVLPAPPTDAGPDTAICFGFSTQLNGSGGVSYLWDADSTLSALNIPNPVAQPTVTTTYYLTATGANGCTWRDSVTVTINPLPIADAGADPFICYGDTAQLNGAGASFFAWDNGATLSDDSIANPRAFPLDTTTYVLTVTDLNGCQDTDTATVTVWLLPPADAGRDTAICIFETTTLQASGGIVYVWDPSPVLSSLVIPDPVASPQTTTTFFVTVTDTNTCVNRDSVTVLVNPLPAANAGPDTAICIGESIQLLATGGVQYVWSPGATLSDPNIADPVANPTVTTPYNVVVTDINGCVNQDNMVLTVNPLPIISAGENQTICQGFAAQLQASGGLYYIWTPGASLTDSTDGSPLAFPEQTTTYEVLGIDGNGCRNTDQVTINVIPKPVADGFAEPDSICKFQQTTLAVTGGVRYQWFNTNPGPVVTVSPRTTTDFWVIPYDNNGCPGDTFVLTVFVDENLPRARFTPSIIEGFVPLEVQFINQSENATRYLWNFGDDTTSMEVEPSHTYGVPGQYTATLWVDNELGCADSISYTFIDVWEASIYYPNAFSPNADGYNDEFYIPNGGYKNFEIQIFDRWGQLVFQSNNPDFRWDGRKDGKTLSEGVYVFRLVANTYDDRRIERGGSITLIR